MKTAVCAGLALLLAACAATAPYAPEPDPCKAGEATWDCQVKRYHDVSAD